MKNIVKKRCFIAALIVICCAVMAFVDGVLMPDYFVKSAIKLVLFLVLPSVCFVFDKNIKLRELFLLKKRELLPAFVLGLSVYILIVAGYLLLKNDLDFSQITVTLGENIGVTGSNFVFVSLYISFVNSLLEEFFFRGFAFLTLKKTASRRFAYIFSAAVFAVYHVAMMIGWFGPALFAIILAGLFAGGIIFNYLNEKSGSVYPSWITHMFANFAINTVGFMLFGII